MNGRDPRNRTAVRPALRIHPEEEISQPLRQEGAVAPPTQPQQGVRGGQTALEDTLGEWLNGNHQAAISDMEASYTRCRTELSTVYRAFQYEYRQNTRLTIMLQNERAEVARYQGVIERIFADFPHVTEHYTLVSSSSESLESDLTDEEINHIIDLTADTDTDSDMEL